MASDIPEELEDTKDEAGDNTADVSEDEASDDASDTTEALDELEAEELEMLTEDEANETIVVDEAAEMRAIRRAELSMEAGEVDEAASDEFVCTSCFLVKRQNQLAAKRKKICLDCAS
jgi:hypothetical protein